MKVQLQAQLTKISSRADRSYKLEFSTRELSGSDAAKLLDELLSEGWLLYSPNDDFEVADVPNEKADAGLGTKTPSTRLRGVLYVFWEQSGKQGAFEEYYRHQMEKIIDYVKEKLT